jgi:predicted TPR repeat methyltransferase
MPTRESKLDHVNEQRLQQALAFQQTEQADKAITLYSLILKDHPNHAMILHLMGIVFAQIGKNEQAIEKFAQCSASQPENAIYHASLANALRRTNRIDEAILSFEKALSLDPHLVSAHNNLALIYFSSDPEKAQKHLTQALQSDPDQIDANFNMGLLLIKRNKHCAIEHFNRAILADPGHHQARFHLAQLYHLEKAYLKALPHYELILEEHPHHPDCLEKAGLVHLALDQHTKAQELLEKALSIDPKIPEIHHNLACIFHHKKDYHRAVEHWLKHIQISGDIETHYNVGVCYLYLGRYEDSTDHLFHVLKNDPQHYHALVNCGAVFLQKNQPQLAIEYYERAQKIKPTEAIGYVLSALSQKHIPQSSPPSYVTDLFDHYAYHYDQHLCDVLRYQLPKRLASLIPEVLNYKEKSQIALDIGCGTGLVGTVIHPYCKRLCGVDLSENMLSIARRKNIYDELICTDIHKHTFKSDCFDWVIMADSLPYFGDLTSIFHLVRDVLKPQGIFLFSVETQHAHDYHLTPSARFAHNPIYIDTVAKHHGFALIHKENIELRSQQNQFIEGHIFVLEKN